MKMGITGGRDHENGIDKYSAAIGADSTFSF